MIDVKRIMKEMEAKRDPKYIENFVNRGIDIEIKHNRDIFAESKTLESDLLPAMFNYYFLIDIVVRSYNNSESELKLSSEEMLSDILKITLDIMKAFYVVGYEERDSLGKEGIVTENKEVENIQKDKEEDCNGDCKNCNDHTSISKIGRLIQEVENKVNENNGAGLIYDHPEFKSKIKVAVEEFLFKTIPLIGVSREKIEESIAFLRKNNMLINKDLGFEALVEKTKDEMKSIVIAIYALGFFEAERKREVDELEKWVNKESA